MSSKVYHRHLALCGLTVLSLMAGEASAALVSITTGTLNATGTQLVSTGTLIFAWDVNGDTSPDPVVNGITFTSVQPGTVTVTNFPAIVNETGTGTMDHYTGGMASLMGDYLGTNTNANGTVSLSGLTIGQRYQVQFLHHQDVNSASIRQMEVRFGNGSGTSGGVQSVGDNQGYITTVIFDADSATQDFTFDPGTDDRAILNAMTVFSVPEPSVALMGGLGVLALLRRRRK